MLLRYEWSFPFNDLRVFGPAKVTITSGVLESQYKKPGEQGYFTVSLRHEGRSHIYGANNRQEAEVLAAHQGKEVTIMASGDSRSGTATLRVVDSDQADDDRIEGDSARNNPDKVGPQDTPGRWNEPEHPLPVDPKNAALAVADNVLAAQKIAFVTTEELRAWVNERLGDGAMPDPLFQSCFQNVFITLQKEGLINKL